MMKKLFAVLLAATMILALAACGQTGTDTTKAEEDTTKAEENTTKAEDNTTESDTEAAVTGQDPTGTEEGSTEPEVLTGGGWTRAESPEVTEEIKALVEKASEGLDGTAYTPIANVASQVVAGVNHLILCSTANITPGAESHYALVTIYEDLEKNAEITAVLNSEAEVGTPGLAGGWTAPETPVVTQEAKEALEKALKGLTGAAYDPAALLATQVVAGTNYAILCEVTAVTPEAVPHYAIVYVYQNLEGAAEITNTVDFA